MAARVKMTAGLKKLLGVKAGPKRQPASAALRKRAANVTEFVLPWPISVNAYWRSTDAGVRVSRAGRKFRRDALAAIAAQGALAAPPGRLAVELEVHPPDAARRDVDNLLKGLLDCMTAAGIYEDDSLIDRVTITRRGVVPGGLVRVRITAWEGGEHG